MDTLRGLEGRERLWPLVPSRQEDLKAMVAAAMEAGWGRAMVVEDPSALESTSSKAFVELFKAAGGIVESYEAQPVQRVDPSNNGRLQRFKDDMAWSWVPTVVVADAPNGPLSRELRAEQQQGRFGGGAPQAPNWALESGSKGRLPRQNPKVSALRCFTARPRSSSSGWSPIWASSRAAK